MMTRCLLVLWFLLAAFVPAPDPAPTRDPVPISRTVDAYALEIPAVLDLPEPEPVQVAAEESTPSRDGEPCDGCAGPTETPAPSYNGEPCEGCLPGTGEPGPSHNGAPVPSDDPVWARTADGYCVHTTEAALAKMATPPERDPSCAE